MKVSSTKNGFGMIEVVVGAAIIAVALVGLVAALHTALQINNDTQKRTQARFLLEEGIEGVRIMRDASWDNIGTLSTSTTYGLTFASSTWATTTGPVWVDAFERSFTVSDVRRDGDDDIAETGTLDANTKRVTVTVAWNARGATTTKQLSAYLMNIFPE